MSIKFTSILGQFFSEFQSLFKQHVGAPNFCKIGSFSIRGIFSELLSTIWPYPKIHYAYKKNIKTRDFRFILNIQENSNKHKLDY